MTILAKNNHGDETTRQLRSLATDILHLDLSEIERAGTTANMSGIQAGRYQLSQRTDSRSIFLQDGEFQSQGSAGTFEGRDEELLNRAAQILIDLGIDETEIDRRSIATEQVEAASFDRHSGEVISAGVRDGKRFAVLTRAIDGVPVWQSSLTLGLTRDGSPGYLHVHWPEIPSGVIETALGYQSALSSDWAAPRIDYAEPESVQAGILHSPPISLVLDRIAAIKVIYRPTTEEAGKKPVRFVDSDGSPVQMPRHFEETPGPVDQQRSRASAA